MKCPVGNTHASSRRNSGSGFSIASMESKSPGWIPTVALVCVAMVVASVVSVIASLSVGWVLWGPPGASGGATATPTVQPGAGGAVPEDSWASTTEVIGPSTVSIQVQTRQGGAEGTGVIYSEDGQILTNAHVVSGADAITVTLSDGRVLGAKVVGADTATDIALIQVQSPPDDLKPATFADSSTLTVGQDVMAMGTPLGLANTATTGIVSALNRPVVTAAEQNSDPNDASFISAIQTDASINPGNSGGPLVNRAGDVVGINSSIASNATTQQQAGSIGLGFAIPSNTATAIAEQLAKDGEATYPLLGVRATDGHAESGSVGYRGAEVVEVSGGSAAAKSGLKNGDVIVKVDDVPTGSATALTAYIRSLEVGSTHTVTFYRGGKEDTADVTLAAK